MSQLKCRTRKPNRHINIEKRGTTRSNINRMDGVQELSTESESNSNLSNYQVNKLNIGKCKKSDKEYVEEVEKKYHRKFPSNSDKISVLKPDSENLTNSNIISDAVKCIQIEITFSKREIPPEDHKQGENSSHLSVDGGVSFGNRDFCKGSIISNRDCEELLHETVLSTDGNSSKKEFIHQNSNKKNHSFKKYEETLGDSICNSPVENCVSQENVNCKEIYLNDNENVIVESHLNTDRIRGDEGSDFSTRKNEDSLEEKVKTAEINVSSSSAKKERSLKRKHKKKRILNGVKNVAENLVLNIDTTEENKKRNIGVHEIKVSLEHKKAESKIKDYTSSETEIAISRQHAAEESSVRKTQQDELNAGETTFKNQAPISSIVNGKNLKTSDENIFPILESSVTDADEVTRNQKKSTSRETSKFDATKNIAVSKNIDSGINGPVLKIQASFLSVVDDEGTENQKNSNTTETSELDASENVVSKDIGSEKNETASETQVSTSPVGKTLKTSVENIILRGKNSIRDADEVVRNNKHSNTSRSSEFDTTAKNTVPKNIDSEKNEITLEIPALTSSAVDDGITHSQEKSNLYGTTKFDVSEKMENKSANTEFVSEYQTERREKRKRNDLNGLHEDEYSIEMVSGHENFFKLASVFKTKECTIYFRNDCTNKKRSDIETKSFRTEKQRFTCDQRYPKDCFEYIPETGDIPSISSSSCSRESEIIDKMIEGGQNGVQKGSSPYENSSRRFFRNGQLVLCNNNGETLQTSQNTMENSSPSYNEAAAKKPETSTRHDGSKSSSNISNYRQRSDDYSDVTENTEYYDSKEEFPTSGQQNWNSELDLKYPSEAKKTHSRDINITTTGLSLDQTTATPQYTLHYENINLELLKDPNHITIELHDREEVKLQNYVATDTFKKIANQTTTTLPLPDVHGSPDQSGHHESLKQKGCIRHPELIFTSKSTNPNLDTEYCIELQHGYHSSKTRTSAFGPVDESQNSLNVKDGNSEICNPTTSGIAQCSASDTSTRFEKSGKIKENQTIGGTKLPKDNMNGINMNEELDDIENSVDTLIEPFGSMDVSENKKNYNTGYKSKDFLFQTGDFKFKLEPNLSSEDIYFRYHQTSTDCNLKFFSKDKELTLKIKDK